MSITIMRKIDFCAGHRLLGHEGKCCNLHGHNYRVEFYVTSHEVDSLGRVVDFSVLDRLFKGWIDEHWDHGFVLWDQDKEAIAALNQVTPKRLYLLPCNPTAENMASYLLNQISPQLLKTIRGYDLSVNRVVLWETDKSSAEVTRNASHNQADALLQSLKPQA